MADTTGASTIRIRAGLWLAGLLGLVFIALGVVIGGQSAAAPVPSGVVFERLFGVRDAFLGGWMLLLLGLRMHRALAIFVIAALLLPLADTTVLGGLIGWARAMRINLPYEVPLLIDAVLLAPLLRRQGRAA